VDGAFVVEDASEDPRRFEVGSTVVVDGEARTVELARRVGGGRPAIKVDGPVTRGTEIAVRRSDLPPPDEGSYYVGDLIGLEVVEEGGERLGRVVEVVPGVANDVLELDSGLLLPLVEDCIRDVQLPQRVVFVAPGFAEPG
jgi:PRC-barrel domain